MTTEPLAEFHGVDLGGPDFCLAYALYDRLQQESGGPDRLRRRATRVHKKLMEELFPICRYVQYYDRIGRHLSVEWIDGDQTFDAKLREHGKPIAYLEVTTASHENEHWVWDLLSRRQPAFAPEGITKYKGKEVVSRPVRVTDMQRPVTFVPIVL